MKPLDQNTGGRMSIDAALKRMRDKMPTQRYCEEAQEELGMSGAMLSGSKTAPDGETIYWNACVFDDDKCQIWHGDLNLTRSTDKLQTLANRIGTIHVTPEHPFRFDGFKVGKAEHGARIVTFDPEEGRT